MKSPSIAIPFRNRNRYFSSNTKFSETETFFRDQIFPKPIPILFSETKNSETETDTFFLIPNDGADAFESDEEYKETMEYDTDFSDSDSE